MMQPIIQVAHLDTHNRWGYVGKTEVHPFAVLIVNGSSLLESSLEIQELQNNL